MSMYIIQENLSTTVKEKITSGVLSAIISTALILLLWFIHLSVPNPPFEVKKGVVILDFGLVDGGFGAPDQGGPSATPPAQGISGGENGGSPAQTGGYGDLVNNDNSDATTALPPIQPPVSKNPVSAIDKYKDKIGKRGGSTGKEGTPDGWPDGTGTTGSGPGGKTGVTGDGTGTRPGGKGNGVYSYNFTHFKLNSTVRSVNADGEGVIACRVSVDCAGRPSVIEYGSRGTTFTGSQANLRSVFDDFLGKSTFTKTGEKCPESGIISLTVKRTY